MVNAKMKKYGGIGGAIVFGGLVGYSMYSKNKWDNAPVLIQLHMVRHGQTIYNQKGIYQG